MEKELDAIQIYSDYFKKKEEVLNNLIEHFINENKSIALWGAGKKGEGFLIAIDPDNVKIQYIYDKSKEKYGKKLSTGHTIEDYHINCADVVFVANSVFELEVVHAIKDISANTKVINLDNIVLGDLTEKEVLCDIKKELNTVKENKICGVVVLYNPDVQVISNINSYASDLDEIYLYDNSINKNYIIEDLLKSIPNAVYIDKEDNLGLPVAFNEVAEIAKSKGNTWMITFDQDSIAENGMIEAMRKFADSNYCDEKIAIIAPTVNEVDEKKDMPDIYYSYFDKVIQSGAMHNLHIYSKIGGYDENLFIDEVDNEYCVRCIVNGYKIIKLNNALLMHNQQDDNVEKLFIEGTTVFINKFSADRYYYRYRNALYCYDKYKDSYPLYALDCKNSIRKMKLQLKYDNDKEIHEEAVRQAIEDYNNGKYGRRYSI